MRTLTLLATLLFAGQASAADLMLDTFLGTTIPAVQANLTEMGYQVRKSEMENGKIEVYVVRENRMGEIYVNTSTGKVTKLEMK